MNDQLPKFELGYYKVAQLSKAGLWLVTTDHLFDLGMLFLRVQEFYESPNPDYRGKSFRLLDYMRWYCTTQSDEKSFTYFSDFEGFNIPSDELEKAMLLHNPDPNNYDLAMSQIYAEVKTRQKGPFYLIGARGTDMPVLAHETAHGMFYLMPEYRAKMTKLVEELPEFGEIAGFLQKDGYSDHVMVDEIQAYLATGLYADLMHLEHIRHPFMKVFATYKAKLLKQPRKRKTKEIKEVT